MEKPSLEFPGSFKGFIDLITVIFTTRYIKRPMHLFGFLGALSFLVGLIVSVYLTIEWIRRSLFKQSPNAFLRYAINNCWCPVFFRRICSER